MAITAILVQAEPGREANARLKCAATQPQMADVGLTGDISDGHFVADLSLAQIFVHDERKLIRRAETAGTRHGTDHYRTRFF